MAKTSPNVFDAIRDLIIGKTKTRLATDVVAVPKAESAIIPANGVKIDSKKNIQFRKDKKRLDAMSRSQIEALRAKLIAEREAKKKKKTIPTF